MFSQFLRSLFRFRKTSVSVLLVLTYVAIGTFLLWDQVRYQYSLPVDDDEYMKLAFEYFLARPEKHYTQPPPL